MTGAIDAPESVRGMFDSIAPRYDLMNRLMTGWMDQPWRRATARAAVGTRVPRALDIATGTGALARALIDAGAREVVGVDISSTMLLQAAHQIGDSEGLSVQFADAMQLPFASASFDACTIGFGLRNLPDFARCLREFERVLVPGGKLAVLELTPFDRPLVRPLFDLYFGRVVPLLGWAVTGNREAYRYLPESVRSFPNACDLATMMAEAGFEQVRWRFLGFGTVALHVGTKRGNGTGV